MPHFLRADVQGLLSHPEALKNSTLPDVWLIFPEVRPTAIRALVQPYKN